MGNETSKGQIIQIARGNLVSRLKAKPLAKGELFVHTGEKTDVSDWTIHDRVTDADLKVLFKGDLFAGDNSDHYVYAIGSGDSLKWGGLHTSSIKDLKQVCMNYPNHIFLYNGEEEGRLYPESDRDVTNPVGDHQPKELDKEYVSGNSLDWDVYINPGDLIFYSAALDQFVVLPMSRATDALVKINVAALVSNSMRNMLADLNEEGERGDNVPSTLKEFLDGPARHYQYLADETGWVPTKVVKEFEMQRDPTTADKVPVTGIIGIDPKNDVDGAVHYVPFTLDHPGLAIYNPDPETLGDLSAELSIYEGDLIFSLPTADGGVRHSVISLYGQVLNQFNYNKTITRADDYATAIWAVKASSADENELEGDLAFVANHDQLKDFIERLFLTKVDIDPVTHKIISSQLPDFLLGAPKYMGHLDATSAEWQSLDRTTTAQEFAKSLLKGKLNWENLDSSEDDTSGEGNPDNVHSDGELSKEVNDKLKSGCYWIYRGDTVCITDFPNMFHADEDADADDYQVDFSDLQATKDAAEQKALTAANELAKAKENAVKAQNSLDTATATVAQYEANLQGYTTAKEDLQSKLDGTSEFIKATDDGTLKELRDVIESSNALESVNTALGKLFNLVAATAGGVNVVDRTDEANVILEGYSTSTLPTTSEKEALIAAIDTYRSQRAAYDTYVTQIADLDTQYATEATLLSGVQTTKEKADEALANAELAVANKQRAKNEADAALELASSELAKASSVKAQHLLNKGDWIIYNGETDRFEIIDNTSSFIGLFVDGVKVAGVVDIEHPERAQSRLESRWVEGRKTPINVQAKETEIKARANWLEFTNPSAVLFKNDITGAALTSKDYIPVITADGYAYNSRFKFGSNQTSLINEWVASETDSTGILGVEFITHADTTNAAHANLLKADTYTFQDRYWMSEYFDNPEMELIDKASKVTEVTTHRIFKPATTSKQDGFNFEWLHFMGPVEDFTDTDIYSYTMQLESNVKVALPQYSGTLTTEGYVNRGFTVVKAIINDLYDKMVAMSAAGHVDWLQTIREVNEIDPRTGKKRKEIFDSKVKQTYEAAKHLILDLYYNDDAENSHDENNSPAFSRFCVYADLSANVRGVSKSIAQLLDASVDILLKRDNGDTVILNPSTNDEQPENVLPNHSGILLNNNSVIDCGEWL